MLHWGFMFNPITTAVVDLINIAEQKAVEEMEMENYLKG